MILFWLCRFQRRADVAEVGPKFTHALRQRFFLYIFYRLTSSYRSIKWISLNRDLWGYHGSRKRCYIMLMLLWEGAPDIKSITFYLMASISLIITAALQRE